MKQVIATANAPAAIGPYSQAIKAGETLYISGQLPIDPATGEFAAQDIQGQTEQSLKNIGAILEEAGYAFPDVVKVTVLLADIADFGPMNQVYAKYFTGDCPARAAFAVISQGCAGGDRGGGLAERLGPSWAHRTPDPDRRRSPKKALPRKKSRQRFWRGLNQPSLLQRFQGLFGVHILLLQFLGNGRNARLGLSGARGQHGLFLFLQRSYAMLMMGDFLLNLRKAFFFWTNSPRCHHNHLHVDETIIS